MTALGYRCKVSEAFISLFVRSLESGLRPTDVDEMNWVIAAEKSPAFRTDSLIEALFLELYDSQRSSLYPYFRWFLSQSGGLILGFASRFADPPLMPPRLVSLIRCK
jgi:hypothetical protein